jgi:hypothetical protein
MRDRSRHHTSEWTHESSMRVSPHAFDALRRVQGRTIAQGMQHSAFGGEETVNYIQQAELLKAELGAFSQSIQHTQNEVVHTQAAARLQRAVDTAEVWAEDPGLLWDHLSEAQRWGYLKLVSYLGLATHELKMLRKRCLQPVHVAHTQSWDTHEHGAKDFDNCSA